MGAFGVVTYKEATEATNVELKTAAAEGFGAMLTNPCFLENISMLQGRALSQGLNDIAIYLNGEYANNLFSIEKGTDYITFLYQGSAAFLKTRFLFEINIF
jgi:hypothetical protein